MKKIFIILALLGSAIYALGQDTITVMQYNLLNFGSSYNSYCTSSNNNYVTKTQYIKTIFGHVKPDIFTVNEIHPVTSDVQYLLDNALNVDGVTYYQKIPYTNYSGSDIVNTLFYNSNLFSLSWQDQIVSTYRDINIYKMFYKPSLAWGDSIYITFMQAHLKAGSTASDASDRAMETNQLMSYLNSHSYSVNNLVMGDFNLCNSSEQAWINLTANSNTNINFNDPVNMAGMWNNNAYYKNYHTQSTSSAGDGCKASGGMDDRFDFILVSNKVKNGTDHVRYIPGSYVTVGQDGEHFNQSINDGTNNSVPSAVLSALAGNSDHLPVRLKLEISQNLGTEDSYVRKPEIFVEYPVIHEVKLHVQGVSGRGQVQLMTLQGEILYSGEENFSGYSVIPIPASRLSAGLYLVSVTDASNGTSIIKLVKTE